MEGRAAWGGGMIEFLIIYIPDLMALRAFVEVEFYLYAYCQPGCKF